MPILRTVVIMNVCQFLQEITYAYSTYTLIMITRRKDDVTANKFNPDDDDEVTTLHSFKEKFLSFSLILIKKISVNISINF